MMNKKAIYHRADDFTLLHGDCIRLMGEFDFKFDMIFADPPYFLSNGGISVQSGKVVCVDKGEWDKGGTPEHIDLFNEEWIAECREHLTENGTIWISGTYHNIFSVATNLRSSDSKSSMSSHGRRRIHHLISRAGTLPTAPSSSSGQESARRSRTTSTMT